VRGGLTWAREDFGGVPISRIRPPFRNATRWATLRAMSPSAKGVSRMSRMVVAMHGGPSGPQRETLGVQTPGALDVDGVRAVALLAGHLEDHR